MPAQALRLRSVNPQPKRGSGLPLVHPSDDGHAALEGNGQPYIACVRRKRWSPDVGHEDITPCEVGNTRYLCSEGSLALGDQD
jgi:hypothetical protein